MEPSPALEQPAAPAKRTAARRARGRNVRDEPTGDNVASGTKINRNIIPSSRLGASIHKYGNVSGRQHGRRTPLPYEMRSSGYPATYDLRGTQGEDPAESPQEGGEVR